MSVSIVTFANLGKKQNLKTSDIAPVIGALENRGELTQIVCQINAGFSFAHTYSAIPVWLRYPIRAFEKISGKTFSRRTMEKLFDFFAQYRLGHTDIVLCHGGYFLPKTARTAHAKGSVTIDIAVSAHLSENAVLEKKELSHLGFPAYEGVYMQLERAYHASERFDYLIALSEYARHTYIDAGYPEERVFVAYPDIDTRRFAPNERAEKKDVPFRVLYLAHTQPLKGLHYLLDAWESLDLHGAELVIVGGFSEMPEELKQHYMDRIQSGTHITWTPGTHTPERFYQDATVLVFPSLTEGFSRVMLEAMACGIPVITTENARGIVEDGKTGYVVPIRDAQAIKEKIQYLYDHRELAAEMGRAARKAVEQKKPFGEAVYEIYEEILQREGRGKS